MKNTFRKMLSVLVAVSVLISAFSVIAFAKDDEEKDRKTVTLQGSFVQEEPEFSADGVADFTLKIKNTSGYDLEKATFFVLTDSKFSARITEDADVPMKQAQEREYTVRVETGSEGIDINEKVNGYFSIVFGAFSSIFSKVLSLFSRLLPFIASTEFEYEGETYVLTAVCLGRAIAEGTAKTVEFVIPGGYAEAPGAVLVATGDCLSAPVAPEAEDRLFLGWFTDLENVSADTCYDFSAPVTADLTLYGIYVSLSRDSDRDGVPDEIERVAGSSVYLSDTDEDGVDDHTELYVNFTDPGDPFNTNPLPDFILSLILQTGEAA